MKARLCGVMLILAASAVFAQNTGGGSQALRTAHYEIVRDNGHGDDGGELIGRQMEALFETYDRLFMFDPDSAAWPLKVRIFDDTAAYNDYAASMLGPVSPGAVYLHYAQIDKRELLLDMSAADARALPYQAFIQFLRAFVSQPPGWMLDGFAVFFSTLAFDDEGELSYEENLAWLPAVKGMKAPPPLEEILLADADGGKDFKALAWSLVSFFMNSGKEEYMRTLTDSFVILSNAAGAAAGADTSAHNAQAVMKRILLGTTPEKLAEDYRQYLDSRRTFAELVTDGQKAYAAGEQADAELCFLKAIALKGGHFVPYYYLGLLAYDADNFAAAEEYYRASIERGADPALGWYALGINAAAAGKSAEAAGYLREAADAAPEKYKNKTEGIIQRLEKVSN